MRIAIPIILILLFSLVITPQVISATTTYNTKTVVERGGSSFGVDETTWAEYHWKQEEETGWKISETGERERIDETRVTYEYYRYSCDESGCRILASQKGEGTKESLESFDRKYTLFRADGHTHECYSKERFKPERAPTQDQTINGVRTQIRTTSSYVSIDECTLLPNYPSGSATWESSYHTRETIRTKVTGQ